MTLLILFTGIDPSISVNVDTTPICQSPDFLVYVAEYLCPEEGMTEGSSMALDTSNDTESDTDRDMMVGVPPNSCTYVGLIHVIRSYIQLYMKLGTII